MIVEEQPWILHITDLIAATLFMYKPDIGIVCILFTLADHAAHPSATKDHPACGPALHQQRNGRPPKFDWSL